MYSDYFYDEGFKAGFKKGYDQAREQLNQDPLPEELYDTYLEYQLSKPTRTLEELEQDLYKYNAKYKTVLNTYSQLILWMIKNRYPLYINSQPVKYIPKPQYFLIPKI